MVLSMIGLLMIVIFNYRHLNKKIYRYSIKKVKHFNVSEIATVIHAVKDLPYLLPLYLIIGKQLSHQSCVSLNVRKLINIYR